MLENLIGQLYQTNTQLPLQYGQMFNQAYQPYYSYLQSQAGNAANLGGRGIDAQASLGGQNINAQASLGGQNINAQSSLGGQNINAQASLGGQYIGNAGQLGSSAMGLYGNLTGQEASMYQSELPMQMEMAKYNSLSPALAGLLGQGGMGSFDISPISMNFNRPDVMRGYQGAVDRSYGELGNAYRSGSQAADQAYGSGRSAADQAYDSGRSAADQAYGSGREAASNAYGQGMQGMRGYDRTMGGAFADNLDRLPTAPYQQQAAPQPAAGSPAAGMPFGKPPQAQGRRR